MIPVKLFENLVHGIERDEEKIAVIINRYFSFFTTECIKPSFNYTFFARLFMRSGLWAVLQKKNNAKFPHFKTMSKSDLLLKKDMSFDSSQFL